MRQLLRKETEWNWTGREQEDFSGIKKLITEKLRLAHFARDRDDILTTEASRTGLGITLWEKKQSDQ